MPGGIQMCLNEWKWLSFRSLHFYSIVKSYHKELSKPQIPVILMRFTLVLYHFEEIAIWGSSISSYSILTTVFSIVLYLTRRV